MSIFDDGSNTSITMALIITFSIGACLSMIRGLRAMDRVLADLDDEPLPQVCDCADCCAWYAEKPTPQTKRWYLP